MRDSRAQCPGCIYFRGNGEKATGFKFCHHYLITGKRRKVAKDGITCLSRDEGKAKKGGAKT